MHLQHVILKKCKNNAKIQGKNGECEGPDYT